MEKWKPVKDFEGVYEVSDLGRVRRLKGGKGTKLGTFLKSQPNTNGYLIVHLKVARKRTMKLVHRIVAEAFIPNPHAFPEVNHLGPKADCRAIRLEWRSTAGHILHHIKKNCERVHFEKRRKLWVAKYMLNKISVWVGYFPTKKRAQAARKAALDAIPDIL